MNWLSLDEKQADFMMEKLKKIQNLKALHLCLTANELKEAGLIKIMAHIAEMKYLNSLTLSVEQNYLYFVDQKQVKEFLANLEKCRNITQLAILFDEFDAIGKKKCTLNKETRRTSQNIFIAEFCKLILRMPNVLLSFHFFMKDWKAFPVACSNALFGLITCRRTLALVSLVLLSQFQKGCLKFLRVEITQMILEFFLTDNFLERFEFD